MLIWTKRFCVLNMATLIFMEIQRLIVENLSYFISKFVQRYLHFFKTFKSSKNFQSIEACILGIKGILGT